MVFLAAQVPDSELILVGHEFAAAAEDVKGVPDGTVIRSFPDTDTAMAYLEKNPPSGATILVKGSRGMALERVIPLL